MTPSHIFFSLGRLQEKRQEENKKGIKDEKNKSRKEEKKE
jgi:hypothetical protein